MAFAVPAWLWIPTALQAVLAAVLCFVPLFDVLGYESSFALGLTSALTGMVIGLGVGKMAKHGTTALGNALFASITHLLPALALLTANAARVRNCDYVEGLGFFLLLPVMSAAYAATLGVLVSRALGSTTRARRVAVMLLLAAPLVSSLWHLYWHPPIYVYDHLWGYFAGSLYDEGITIDARLLAFRGGTLLRILGVALVLWVWRQHRARSLTPVLAAAMAIAATVGYDAELGPRLGYSVDRGDIERELSAVVERPGLVIHLPPELSPERQQAIADDHAFRLAQLERVLDVDPPWPIHSYVYRDAGHKARLMGGHNTMLAKPWLHEIHIHGTYVPHDVVAHELAHAVAADFADGPLRVSASWGVLVNMGLVEGLAEAVTVERGTYDVHTWARALRELGHAPDLRQVASSTGFWTHAAGRAYAVSGSFVRFLLDAHGPSALKRAYAHGDFEGAYGKSLDELVGEWEHFIDGLALSPREKRLAEDQFRTPSIFARTCAHEVAQLRARAAAASPLEAVAIHRQICAHLDDAPHARFDLAMAMRRAGDIEGFLAESKALLDGPGLTQVRRTRLRDVRGEIFWQRGELEAAQATFAEVAADDAGLDTERLQWVRLWALSKPPELRDAVRQLLGHELPPIAAVLVLDELARSYPEEKTLPYLIARQLIRADAHDRAVGYLERAAGHPFAPIEAERLRLCAEAYWRSGNRAAARAAYEELVGKAETSGERARAADWIARLDWLAARVQQGT